MLPRAVEALLGGDDPPLGLDRVRRLRGTSETAVPGAVGTRQENSG